MTKRVRSDRSLPLAVLLLVAAATVPPAHAHGAPEPRELDTRVLLDDDGAIGYGGCTEAGCNPATPPEGLDLLALDVREAWLGGAPAVVFRFVFQTEAVRAGRGLLLELAVAGQAHEFLVASDGDAYTSGDVARLDGPVDVGDGHPKALDAWVPHSALGVRPGATIDGIVATSLLDGAADDTMPGGWYHDGIEVPHVPHDPGEAMPPTSGTYAVKGPAPLLTLGASAPIIDLAAGRNATLQVGNVLASTAQFVQVTLELPPGVQAGVGDPPAATAELSLEAAADREVRFTVAPGSGGGNVTIIAASDLGARAIQVVQVAAPPPAAANATGEPAGGAKESPPFAGALGAALLCIAAACRRRVRPARATDLTSAQLGARQA